MNVMKGQNNGDGGKQRNGKVANVMTSVTVCMKATACRMLTLRNQMAAYELYEGVWLTMFIGDISSPHKRSGNGISKLAAVKAKVTRHIIAWRNNNGEIMKA